MLLMDDVHRFVQEQVKKLQILPELHLFLERIVAADLDRLSRNDILQVIPRIVRLFSNTHEIADPFAAAWLTMYAAIIRLDDLQDGDELLPPFPVTAPTHEQYTILFGYYLFAHRLLDLLNPKLIPFARITRVRQFWSDMMLRMAAGQYRDLNPPHSAGTSILDEYQQIAQAKTGATFALAFGGTTMLLTDDPTIYEGMALIGEIYGTLLQYGDDINDAATQPNTTLTLPAALKLVQSESMIIDAESVFPVIYPLYYAAVEEHLKCLPLPIQSGIRSIFEDTFPGSSGGV
jgi:hypothetical protein